MRKLHQQLIIEVKLGDQIAVYKLLAARELERAAMIFNNPVMKRRIRRTDRLRTER
ncbi:hypothetical protein D3C84_1207380 [compost metagenome]